MASALRRQTEDALFVALADPTRRDILALLRGGPLPVGAIAERFPISRPAVYKHLRVLRRTRLVRERREGRQRLCSLDARPLAAVDDWLAQYRHEWAARLDRLQRHAEARQAESRAAESRGPVARASESRAAASRPTEST
jgi:DNA-binding transcriptional ArsR family regulator